VLRGVATAKTASQRWNQEGCPLRSTGGDIVLPPSTVAPPPSGGGLREGALFRVSTFSTHVENYEGTFALCSCKALRRTKADKTGHFLRNEYP
jgi:hypothetical protein